MAYRKSSCGETHEVLCKGTDFFCPNLTLKLGVLFFFIGCGLELGMIGSGFYKQKLDTEEDILAALEKREAKRIFLETLHTEALKVKAERDAKKEAENAARLAAKEKQQQSS